MPLLYVCVCCRDQKRVLDVLLLPGTGATDVCEPPCAGKGTQVLLQDQPVFFSTQISLQALITEFLIKKKGGEVLNVAK